MPPEKPAYDRRITPIRDDLAAEHLRGILDAPRYVPAQNYRIGVAAIPLRKGPDAALPYETELLFGEMIDIYEIAEGWAWGQATRDGYCGYLPASALAEPLHPTHRVSAIRSFLYPAASIKATPLGFLPFGAEVTVEAMDGKFAKTRNGYLFTNHLAQLDEKAEDPVAVAERFLGIPYLWGGKSSLGIDCSGLVQTACHACGIPAPRDSDMQEKALGEAIAIPNDPGHFRRGDLLFWPGHVALAQGNGRMLHATAYSMSVISEEIGPALERIAGAGHPLRTARRLTKP